MWRKAHEYVLAVCRLTAAFPKRRYYLILARDLGYGSIDKMNLQLEEVSRMLNAYARAILASDFWFLTSFLFTLYLQSYSNSHSRAPLESRAMAEIQKVLIVEDSEQGSLALEIALSTLPGIAVVLASSAEEAVRILNENADGKICAIVTDIHLGEMDGFQLIEYVRSDSRYSSLPIIVISGDPDRSTPLRVYRLGANAFFEKPYSPQKVRESMERLLNGDSSNASTQTVY